MGKQVISRFKGLVIGLLLIPTAVLASSAELGEAVKAYYAGRPSRAIEIIKPLAQSGEVSAQLLLGNILYSLSKAEQMSATDEAIGWYLKAAMQDSAEANNALGVIYYNQWIETRLKQDAALAIAYYEKAIKLGAKVVREPLAKLKRLSGVSAEKAISMAKKVTHQESLAQQAVGKPESQKIVLKPIVETDMEVVVEKPEPVVDAPEPAKELPKVVEVGPEPAVDVLRLIADASEEVAEEEVVMLSERPLLTLELKEIADECGKYKQVGFNVYADTIKGAATVGNAKVQKIDPGVLRLIMTHANVRVLLNLKDVPQKLLRDLQPGDRFAVAGIILQSQLVGTECNIHLQYNRGTS